MNKKIITTQQGHIIAMSRDPDFLQRVKDIAISIGIRVSGKSRAMLVANEFLTIKTDFVVIDLRIMGVRCLQMLSLAKERNIAMLGIGCIPLGMIPSQLADITIIKFDELDRYLGKSLKREDELPAEMHQAAAASHDDKTTALLSSDEVAALFADG